MRKEAGFEVTDHIVVGYKTTGDAKKIFDRADFLKDVLADSTSTTIDGFAKDCDINGETVTISVKRV